MTVAARPRTDAATVPTLIGGSAGLLAGLAILVILRWGATVEMPTSTLAVGGLFGMCLLGLCLSSGWRPGRILPVSIPWGIAGGAALVGIAFLTRPAPHLWLPAAPFGPWVVVTVLVATAEEAILRGVLFDRLARDRGALAAVVMTSLVFAAVHVPVYGLQVVPLDLGVGLCLGGLRLASGGVTAPAMAHVIADLATWWL